MKIAAVILGVILILWTILSSTSLVPNVYTLVAIVSGGFLIYFGVKKSDKK